MENVQNTEFGQVANLRARKMLKIETTLKIKKNQAIMYWIIVVKVRIASYGTATNIKLFIRNTQRYSCLTRR